MQKQPRVLIFDIETSDMLVSTFGIRDQFIADDQIVRDMRILAIGAKWMDQGTVMYREARTSGQEKGLLRWIWGLLDEADIVVGQNSKKFDSKVLTGRFIVYGMKPPSPYKHLDTLIISKNVARFPSHKLSYVSKVVNKKYKKLSHSAFPGRSLWTACMEGNKKAWTEMKRYNIHDVLSTEEFYKLIRAWAPASSPKPYEGLACETCGVEGRVIKCGKRLGHQRFQCQVCGVWTQGKKEKGMACVNSKGLKRIMTIYRKLKGRDMTIEELLKVVRGEK